MTCRDNMTQRATPYGSCDQASQGMQTRLVLALPSFTPSSLAVMNPSPSRSKTLLDALSGGTKSNMLMHMYGRVYAYIRTRRHAHPWRYVGQTCVPARMPHIECHKIVLDMAGGAEHSLPRECPMTPNTYVYNTVYSIIHSILCEQRRSRRKRMEYRDVEERVEKTAGLVRLEGLNELLFRVRVFHLSRHERPAQCRTG